MAAPATADARMTFFFAGNCQLQFYACQVAKLFPGQVVCTGRPQVPYDAPLPMFLTARELFQEAQRRKAAGGVNVLILQETFLSQFTRGATEGRARLFAKVQRFPHAHFRALWPSNRLKVPVNFTPRMINRLFAAEKHEFEVVLERCGPSVFNAEDFWRSALEDVQFYYPGHPDGRVLLSLYDGYLHQPLSEITDKAGLIRQAIAASPGLPVTSLHPIDPELGDAIGVQWRRRPPYELWEEVGKAGSAAELHALTPAKAEFAAAFDPIVAALFQNDLAAAFVRIRDMEAAALHSAEAAKMLPGQVPVLNRALNTNSRVGDWRSIEATLRANLGHLRLGSLIEPWIGKWLERTSRPPEALDILSRLSEEADHAAWLADLVENAPAQAEAA